MVDYTLEPRLPKLSVTIVTENDLKSLLKVIKKNRIYFVNLPTNYEPEVKTQIIDNKVVYDDGSNYWDRVLYGVGWFHIVSENGYQAFLPADSSVAVFSLVDVPSVLMHPIVEAVN